MISPANYLGDIDDERTVPLGRVLREGDGEVLHSLSVFVEAALDPDVQDGWTIRVGSVTEDVFLARFEIPLVKDGLPQGNSTFDFDLGIGYQVGDVPAVRFVKRGSPATISGLSLTAEFSMRGSGG